MEFKMEINKIKITDEDYPKRLKEIQNPPKELYVVRRLFTIK